jgi:cobalamin biosynthetic protein CobC
MSEHRELEHGGRLRHAAVRYGIAPGDWLDLSTGVNPNGWPVPPIPAKAWSCLPEDDDGLESAARTYYGAQHLLPVAGSQAAIQTLPYLRPRSRVAVIAPGYNEHAHAWRSAGHEVSEVAAERIAVEAPKVDVLVIINPNNPSGANFTPIQLLAWHAQLATRGGWLVVDEAFMDASPEASVAPYCPRPGLVVLRSLGKFFGLAGVRVGFALGERELLARLRARLGPWTVNGPARFVATHALKDTTWQHDTRAQLVHASQRLALLLARYGLAPDGGCAHFQWVRSARAAELHEQLAQHDIFTRLYDQPASLRFGLPGHEQDWMRFERALHELTHT